MEGYWGIKYAVTNILEFFCFALSIASRMKSSKLDVIDRSFSKTFANILKYSSQNSLYTKYDGGFERLEISKKVRHVFVPQGKLKLQCVKDGRIWFTAQKWSFQGLSNLTSCNFVPPWSTKKRFTFQKTSNQYYFGAWLISMLQHSKCVPGHAENSHFT